MKRPWLTFSLIVHMLLYNRLYEWFDVNVNQNTIPFSVNKTFAMCVFCIPFVTSGLYFILFYNLENNKASNNEITKSLFGKFFGAVVKLYNIVCFVYCIVDWNFKYIEKFLYKLAEYVQSDNTIMSGILLCFALVSFGLFERYNKKTPK